MTFINFFCRLLCFYSIVKSLDFFLTFSTNHIYICVFPCVFFAQMGCNGSRNDSDRNIPVADGSFRFKLILVGDSGVGKTSILQRFTSDEKVTSDYVSTVGVDFKIKGMRVDSQNVELQLWDTCGQDRFRAICRSYFRDVNGVLFVYDVTQRETFEKISDWYEDFLQNSTQDISQVSCLLVANKVDCLAERKVNGEEGEAFARRYKMKYIETSAWSREKTNIVSAFGNVAAELLRMLKDQGEATRHLPWRKESFMLHSEPPSPQRSSVAVLPVDPVK
jgi:small GTP-binding protein